jgi:hypothetical protein
VRSIECFRKSIIVAVRSPCGTELEVPDPEVGMEFPKRHFHLFLKSMKGSIQVFLVPFVKDEAEPGSLTKILLNSLLEDQSTVGVFQDYRSLEAASEHGIGLIDLFCKKSNVSN